MIDRFATIEERRRLTEKLTPIFGKDAAIAEVMLIAALGLNFVHPIQDEHRYLSRLRRLPRGGTARPRVEKVNLDDNATSPRWTVMFTDETGTHYQSSAGFADEQQAQAYGSAFVACLLALQKNKRMPRARTSRPLSQHPKGRARC